VRTNGIFLQDIKKNNQGQIRQQKQHKEATLYAYPTAKVQLLACWHLQVTDEKIHPYYLQSMQHNGISLHIYHGQTTSGILQ
jgi:hypothetical protein